MRLRQEELDYCDGETKQDFFRRLKKELLVILAFAVLAAAGLFYGWLKNPYR